MLLLAAGLTKA